MRNRFRKMTAVVLVVVLMILIISMGVVSAGATQNRYYNFNSGYSISGSGANDMVSIAAVQLGLTGSQLGYSEQWCADFVSDCAILANQSDAIPAAGYCPTLRQNIINSGGWYVDRYSAQAGDIVFYGNNGADHVEIVYAASGGNVSTYGGNSGSAGNLYGRSVKQHATQTQSIAYIVRPNYMNKSEDPVVNGLYYHGAEDYSNFRPVIKFSNPETVADVKFALKFEGSDWHWYNGGFNGADAWYCDVLSNDLGTGEEIVCHCYVTGKNGSYKGYAFPQDPKVEELLYHGSTNNSDFRPVAKIYNPDSVSEVKFAVKYEGGDWHWYDGQFNGSNAWYCDVLSSNLGRGTIIVCHCYIYGRNGHTKGYILPELTLDKDSTPIVDSWYFDGATDHSDFRPVIRLQNPETVSYVKFAVKYEGGDWHWYDGQFNGGNAWFCDVLSNDLGSGKTIICHGYVYANNGSYLGYPFPDLKLDKDYDNPIVEEWKYNIDHNNNSIHYQIKCENPETVSKVQFAVRTDNTDWKWQEGDFNEDNIWSIDIPIDDFNEDDNVVCHCYVKGRNGSNNGYPFSEIKINDITHFAIGDTNLDGFITIGDVTAIQRHLAELEVFTDEQLSLADTNGDDEINISDATHLQMYLAEYDVKLGKK